MIPESAKYGGEFFRTLNDTKTAGEISLTLKDTRDCCLPAIGRNVRLTACQHSKAVCFPCACMPGRRRTSNPTFVLSFFGWMDVPPKGCASGVRSARSSPAVFACMMQRCGLGLVVFFFFSICELVSRVRVHHTYAQALPRASPSIPVSRSTSQ